VTTGKPPVTAASDGARVDVRPSGRATDATKGVAMADVRPRSDVESEIKETFGLVPSFFSRIPDEVLDLEWELMKRLELGETLIPNKYKELIGVAVHSETKCRYCTLFHTEAAKLFGATDEEIQEAVHFAKFTVGWSVYVNGIQQDYDQFADEMQQITGYLAEQAANA
jgi:AhpD family alkylhydroperoxidase